MRIRQLWDAWKCFVGWNKDKRIESIKARDEQVQSGKNDVEEKKYHDDLLTRRSRHREERKWKMDHVNNFRKMHGLPLIRGKAGSRLKKKEGDTDGAGEDRERKEKGVSVEIQEGGSA